MSKPKRITITDSIFRADFIIQAGGDLNALVNVYAKKCKRDPWAVSAEGKYGYCGGYDDDKGGVIWLHKKAGCRAITHEALHATYRVFRIIQCPLNDDTEEIFAYYQDWLVGEIVARLF